MMTRNESERDLTSHADALVNYQGKDILKSVGVFIRPQHSV